MAAKDVAYMGTFTNPWECSRSILWEKLTVLNGIQCAIIYTGRARKTNVIEQTQKGENYTVLAALPFCHKTEQSLCSKTA